MRSLKKSVSDSNGLWVPCPVEGPPGYNAGTSNRLLSSTLADVENEQYASKIQEKLMFPEGVSAT